MQFPVTRLRRLRQSPAIRSLLTETRVLPENLIAPIFLVPGSNIQNTISSMPEQFQLSTDKAIEKVKLLSDLGVKTILLFGIPEKKDDTCESACADNGIVQKSIAAIKSAVSGVTVATDLCFCEYTAHGHCGIMKGERLDNDATLEKLAKQAVSHAKAGADIIAPSGMIDGCVGTIRDGLDEAGFSDALVMGYSAKFASSFYGPFREAVNSAPQFGDRKTYQMNSANLSEAMREIELDIEEGADIIMVKPALAYLDVIHQAKKEYNMPTAAYNVSGEYAMIKLAAEKGLIDGKRMMLETLTSIKRAGADIIISYFAEEFAKLYQSGKANDF